MYHFFFYDFYRFFGPAPDNKSYGVKGSGQQNNGTY